MKPLQDELKAAGFARDQFDRYQAEYKINTQSVSTYHLQQCRDLITRFQRVLNA
jgi:hypothetical protein